MIEKIVKVRYLKPLEGLKEDSVLKGILSTFGTFFAFLGDIFYVKPELIALLVISVFVDFLTGVIASKKNKIPINSLGFRQTIVKVFEYALFLFVLTGISNVFGNTNSQGWIKSVFEVVRNIDMFGYFFLIMTELKSIAENLTGSEGRLVELFNEIKKKITKHK